MYLGVCRGYGVYTMVAIVVAQQAIIADAVAKPDQRIVKAIGLYAIKIRAGERRGPYTDADELAYTEAALRRRCQSVSRRRPRRR